MRRGVSAKFGDLPVNWYNWAILQPADSTTLTCLGGPTSKNMPPLDNCSPALFGATSPSLLAQIDDPTSPYVPFGLYSLLYGTPERPVTCRYDAAGNVDQYTRLNPVVGRHFIPMAGGHFAPAFGERNELALVPDAKKPWEIFVGGWDQLAAVIAENYNVVRNGVLTHPLEGFYLAKFFSDEAVQFASCGDTGKFDPAAAGTKIAEMEIIRDALLTCHPEWQHLHGIRKRTYPSRSSWAMNQSN
jgi:hypothetical protein